MSKTQAVLVAGLYTSLGSYYTLKSLIGVIFEVIIIIFIVIIAILAVMIIACGFFPFYWPVAIAAILSITVSSIIFSKMANFFSDTLHVQSKLFPSVPSACFDKNVELVMNDGSKKKIIDIIVGDILQNNNLVTTRIQVSAKANNMFTLNGVIVSESHILKYNDKWIPVAEHPDRIEIEKTNYKEEYLYCLNTSSKQIIINDLIFTDWDEIYDEELDKINNLTCELRKKLNVDLDIDSNNIDNIDKYLNGGFIKSTKICLENDTYVQIKDVKVGDILKGGDIVYGIVEIDATNKQIYDYNYENEYYLGYFNHDYIGRNIQLHEEIKALVPCISKVDNNDIKEDKLYHLLTNTSTFNIDNLRFYDYNSLINLHLGK